MRRPLPHLSPEYAFGLDVFVRRFFEDFFARFRTPFVLVLDNWQDAGEAAALHAMVGGALAALPEKERKSGEVSAKQVFHRLAGTWAYWGWKGGYFDTEDDAHAFYDEMCHMLAAQKAAPNSPQWFNTGLHWAYGIDGPSQGHYYVDHKTGKLTKSKSAYEHPQPHACFIQSIADDLVNEGGIMDLWVREARLFKYGSGTGTNFSALRGEGERLSGGGRSSGLMSFLKIGDRAAGAIKSGGTTRRAAKMVVVDVDHPDIEAYIDWKVREEQKVAALVTGSKINQKHLKAIMKACVNCEGSGDDCFQPEKNPALKREVKLARRNHVPDNLIQRVIQFAKQGYTDIDFPIYDTDWDSEAYLTVSGQNSNNSVRVTADFLDAVRHDRNWNLTRRTGDRDFTVVVKGAIRTGGGDHDRAAPVLAEQLHARVDAADVDQAPRHQLQLEEPFPVGAQGDLVVDAGGQVAEMGRRHVLVGGYLEVENIECVTRGVDGFVELTRGPDHGIGQALDLG